MPIKAKERRIVSLTVALAMLLMACSALFLIPAQPVKADAGDNYPDKWKSAAKDTVVDDWREWNRECTSWASWALSDRNGYTIPFHDYASGWGADATAIGFAPDNTAAKGAIAWWKANAPGASSYGHVAWVSDVDSGGGITVEQYNIDFMGNYSTSYYAKGSSKWPTGFIHFPNNNSSSTPTATLTPTPTPPDNTVLAVKKLTMSDGTNEVFWAKNTDVFESWWRSGTGITTTSLVNIAQKDIKAIDVQLMPNNEHLLYTATTNTVWETWWYPGQSTHTAAILTTPSPIRAVQKTLALDGVTNQLYVLTDTGASEYWWNSGSNGVQGGSLYTLAYPVAMQKFVEPNGTQVLYVADQNYAYMVRWGGGLNGIQVSQIINVSGITSLTFSQDSDGKHRLYVGSSSGAIWEASWYTGGSIGTWYMAGGAPVVALQKWEDDSEQVLYEATSGGVFEYYWPTSSNSLASDTIVGGLGNIHAFVRSTDPNGVQSVYTATGTNVLESWWIPGGNGITNGTIA